MGDLNVHGTAVGSATNAIVIAAFQIPANNAVQITDIKTTMENPGAQGVFKVEKSDTQGFASFDEIDRTVMPDPGTFVSTTLSIEIPGGKWVRVRHIEGTAGDVSCSLIGKTSKAGLQIP